MYIKETDNLFQILDNLFQILDNLFQILDNLFQWCGDEESINLSITMRQCLELLNYRTRVS
jgi:hypothetical protein